MRASALIIAAAASCLFLGTARAEFTHLSTELVQRGAMHKPELGSMSLPGPWDVWQLYANFTPGSDANVVAIGVAFDGTPMVLENVLEDGKTLGSGFNNWSLGLEMPLALDDSIYQLDSTAAVLDTWLTIGNNAGYTPAIDPETGEPYIFSITPDGWGGFGGDGLGGPVVTCSAVALFTVAESGYGLPDEDGRVLLANFVVQQGEHVQGSVNMSLHEKDQIIGATFSTLDESSEPCFGDLTGSGDVGVFDLLLMLGDWGECPGCASDLNSDGVVDVFDLLALLGAWGPCE